MPRRVCEDDVLEEFETEREGLAQWVEELFLAGLDEELWERIRTLEAGQNEYGYDPFGFEPAFLTYVLPFAQFLYRSYFRAQVHGLDRIPDEGRVLLVANHTGQIPIDGLIIGTACLLDRQPPRMARSMIERWAPEVPFASYVLARSGQVVGTRDNCRLLLDRGGCILVFPEGVGGINKTYEHAYELQSFGLGFMRLALENETPIVPIGVVGGEEQMPAVWNAETVAEILGMPSFPVTPTWPLFGPAGAIPLPTKYHLRVGEPMSFEGASDDEDRVVQRKVDRVKSAIRELIEQGLRDRQGVFF